MVLKKLKLKNLKKRILTFFGKRKRLITLVTLSLTLAFGKTPSNSYRFSSSNLGNQKIQQRIVPHGTDIIISDEPDLNLLYQTEDHRQVILVSTPSKGPISSGTRGFVGPSLPVMRPLLRGPKGSSRPSSSSSSLRPSSMSNGFRIAPKSVSKGLFGGATGAPDPGGGPGRGGGNGGKPGKLDPTRSAADPKTQGAEFERLREQDKIRKSQAAEIKEQKKKLKQINQELNEAKYKLKQVKDRIKELENQRDQIKELEYIKKPIKSVSNSHLDRIVKRDGEYFKLPRKQIERKVVRHGHDLGLEAAIGPDGQIIRDQITKKPHVKSNKKNYELFGDKLEDFIQTAERREGFFRYNQKAILFHDPATDRVAAFRADN